MTGRRTAVVLLVLALGCAVAAVASWLAASSTVMVAPVLDGEPETASVVYSAPLLALALLLATAAGVLAVLGGTRLRRGRR
ncbi:hypothetical protein [Mycolicibacterium thermoresistibile]